MTFEQQDILVSYLNNCKQHSNNIPFKVTPRHDTYGDPYLPDYFIRVICGERYYSIHYNLEKGYQVDWDDKILVSSKNPADICNYFFKQLGELKSAKK